MLTLLASLTLQQAAAIAWPSCDAPELEPRVDCVLDASDGSGWSAAFDYEPTGPNARRLEILIYGVDGAPVERIELRLQRGFRAPMRLDLDSDGLEDLAVPRATGLVNSDWTVLFGEWAGFITINQSMNGHTIEPVADGQFAVHARSSAARHDVEIFARQDDALQSRAILAIEFDEAGSTCRLSRASDERGEAYYCALALDPSAPRAQ